MAKVDFRRLKEFQRNELDELVTRTFRNMKKQKTFDALIRGFLTDSEMVMFGRRIRIAQWLLVGKSCRQIMNKLHAGQDTVQSVDKWLRRECKTYETIFPSLYLEFMQKAARNRKKYAEPYSWQWVRNKYTMHFLLANALIDDAEARRMLAEEDV